MAEGQLRRDHSTNLWHATAGPALDAAPLEGATTADVAIVGGGFTGCSAALHLAREGASVRLVEAHAVGHGGSGRNVGLVNAGLWMLPETVEATLGEAPGRRLNEALGAAPAAVFSLIEEHGIDCEATQTGTLHVAHAASGVSALAERCRQYASRGADIELLDAGDTAAMTGARGLHGALVDRRAGTIQPLAYVRGLARAAMRAGARVHEGSPALAIVREGGAWRVDTPGGSLSAGALIVAANAYDEAATAEGPRAYTPIHYLQFATAPLSPGERASVLPERQGCWDTATVMSSFRLDAAGRLVIGGMGSLEGTGARLHRNWALRKMRRLFPQISATAFEHGWCGRIAMTRDKLPKVVRLGPRAVSIFGYSGRGIAPGTVFGRAAARFAASDQEDAFPLPLADRPSEPLAWIRQRLIDIGAMVAHAAAART